MYKLFFFLQYMALSRTLQSQEPQAPFWSGCHPCKIYPKGDCLWQIHSHSPRMLHLPVPPMAVTPARSSLISYMAATPTRSIFIPQGCVPCQIHPYPPRLCPLPDPPLFLKVASTGQIYFSSQKLLVLPDPSLSLKAFSCQTYFYPSRLLPLPDLPLFLKTAATARSTLTP